MASGVCVVTAPDHFELTGNTATARAAEIDPDENVLDAAESCPALAISVTEDGRDLLE